MLKYALTHPDGFEEMRYKKSGSFGVSLIIIMLFFFGKIAEDRMYGFQFRAVYDVTFNIIPYIIKSIILFMAWVVANWSVCTLLDGEGTLRNIFIYSAYALVPYVAQIYINILLSHILVREEYIFMQVTEISGTVWTCLLLFSAVKAVHQYTTGNTFRAVFLTFIMMLVMLVVAVLFMVLIQQICIFISDILTEIIYRLRI